MALSRIRLFYIIAVLISGIAAGLLILQQPHLQQAAVPPAAWPFAVSLVLDLAIGQLAAQGRVQPLTMGDRFVAVIGAGLIVTVMVALG
ncbi:hypothetical protein KHP60_06055 [Microvirga sp. 3-52]|uniref:hypothetical protein n=1 Tax=Microvirga sp. 3-52 TaxID=2792425 RepID=UPI001AC9F385|nr:hypothetical protein [Microvirga sp. 3-52]MBO1904549.1 hypothetical protein [Microvirga sp. 3-52]MBS7451911.1 hypothetical protein [Microvirga sp. 3-52]